MEEENEDSIDWLKSISNTTTNIGKVVNEFNNFVNHFSKKISNFLEATSGFGTKLLKALEDFSMSYVAFIEILNRYDWWMLPFSNVPYHEIISVMEKASNMSYENGKKYINNFILKHYQANDYKLIKEIINNWNIKYFRRRMEIFKDAFDAHKNKKFTLSIPAISLQVEGILWEWNWNNSPKQKEIKKAQKHFGKKLGYNDKFINEINDILNQCNEDNIIKDFPDPSEIEKQYNLHRIRKFLDSSLIKPNKQFDEIPPEEYKELKLNRDLIAHGLYLNYEKKEAEVNSLKLFLLLDLLHEIIKNFNKG